MSEATGTGGPPTVVLVHGAFADASSWNGVIERLQAKGVQVTAVANPLRGVSIDAAYLAGLLQELPGPVVAVGHSYGGAVITNAATQAPNVVGLADAEAASKDSVLNSVLVPLHYPAADGGEPPVEFAVNPARFHDAVAADLPAEQAAVLAATQRPAAELAFSQPTGPPAWKDRPSWAVVATADKAAGTDVIGSMARRAGARITEVAGSHVIMVSQPQAVTDVILDAVAGVGEGGPTQPQR
jgi:pimeloyl-ACP methyl ester carboxylesterase